MIVLLSPAKKQNFEMPATTQLATLPTYQRESKLLIDVLKTYNSNQLQKLMHISPSLALLNAERFAHFSLSRFKPPYAKQAIFAFQGDAYQKINIDDCTDKQLEFLQEHLIILSGLYGCLRPLDLIQPYRLEMKTPLPTPHSKDLYEFWSNKLTALINKRLSVSNNKLIINLASQEYAKAINTKDLNGDFITIDFKDLKNGQYKSIGIFAKRARGLMVRYIAKHKVKSLKGIKSFAEEDYSFSETLSTKSNLVFVRG